MTLQLPQPGNILNTVYGHSVMETLAGCYKLISLNIVYWLRLCTEDSTDDRLFKSISLYSLVSTWLVTVSSSELLDISSASVETWSFIFFREELNMRLITLVGGFILLERSARTWSIDQFTPFCRGFFCTSAWSTKSFTFPFLSIRAFFFVPVISRRLILFYRERYFASCCLHDVSHSAILSVWPHVRVTEMSTLFSGYFQTFSFLGGGGGGEGYWVVNRRKTKNNNSRCHGNQIHVVNKCLVYHKILQILAQNNF